MIPESPKLYIILAVVALGSSGFSLINSTDSVDIQDLEHKLELVEAETQRRLDDMDKKIQIEMRLLVVPVESDVENIKEDVKDIEENQMEYVKNIATLLERTRP